ncbi:hypothetical protein CISIN_1g034529mg [Citrus sinensis]|uniref:Uncharacterized protein n=1 Tax=Citrus sinensis TaxID=2711 RepID=A0A067E3V3_CITSI|nr:hypothetical protein CISIN_1g034529mg [Citrus sinensis]
MASLATGGDDPPDVAGVQYPSSILYMLYIKYHQSSYEHGGMVLGAPYNLVLGSRRLNKDKIRDESSPALFKILLVWCLHVHHVTNHEFEESW